MNEQSRAVIINAMDECIESYIQDRRSKMDSFIDRHFSLQETMEIQKRHILADIFLNPLNSLWAIPFLTLKKIVETFDKLGWPKLSPAFEKVPSSIKTRYQTEMEHLIRSEFLGIQSSKCTHYSTNALVDEIKKHSVLREFINSGELRIEDLPIDLEFKRGIENYSSSQAMISDLAGSVMTVFAGWLFFGDKTLGVLGLGDRIARKVARDKASSNFFLGDGLGSAFYNIFPPAPTGTQVFVSTLVVGVLLTAVSLCVSVLCDPLRKRLGLHKRRLSVLLDDLEERLFLQTKKAIKNSFKVAKAKAS